MIPEPLWVQGFRPQKHQLWPGGWVTPERRGDVISEEGLGDCRMYCRAPGSMAKMSPHFRPSARITRGLGTVDGA